jgi:hypothetical protein
LLEKRVDSGTVCARAVKAGATKTGLCESIMAHCMCMSLTGVDRCNHLVADTPS